MLLYITLAIFLIISGGIDRIVGQQEESNLINDFIRKHLHVAQSKLPLADKPGNGSKYAPAPGPQPSYLKPAPVPVPAPTPQPSYPAPAPQPSYHVPSPNTSPYVQPTPPVPSPPQPAYAITPSPPSVYETAATAATTDSIPNMPGPPSFAVNPVPNSDLEWQYSIPPCESWQEWSACSSNCGQGTRKRNRNCGYKTEMITQTCLTKQCE